MPVTAIVDQTRFAISIVFAVAGVVMLLLGRGGRGWNRYRQAGALLLVGAALFIARGLGLIDL